MKKPLHFVFLQGMPSTFFSRVAQSLAGCGCKTTGINFCVGDWLFWRGKNTVNYRGSLVSWPEFFQAFCQKEGITDLVLLGEQRHYHKEAVMIATFLGIRVTVTDFGYLRPDWITLERNGMSGNSHFPIDPKKIYELAKSAPEVDLTPKYSDSFWKMAWGDLVYSFGTFLFGWLYPHYRQSHRRPHPLIYFPAMGLRTLQLKLGRMKAVAAMQEIWADKRRYFIFPLQLEHDFQIVAYSPFEQLLDAVYLVLDSFAKHSGANCRLVIKVHPWDPGLRNWKKLIDRYAQQHSIAHRVIYLDGGYLDEIIPPSAGMITINSTSGLRALQLGRPLVTLGQTIYNVPGMTFQDGLDRFWKEAVPPDPELVSAFIKAIANTIQLRGVFFDEPGLSVGVDKTTKRLLNQANAGPCY